MTKAKPILRWPGGKTRMLKQLLPMIPADATCYVECFGGGAAVLLAKPRHTVEIINDQNGDIVSLMRNAQYHLPTLLNEMRWFVTSRDNLRDYRAQPGLTEIQRAARFLLRNRTSFGGGGTSFAVSKTTNVGYDHDDVSNRLEAYRQRLSKVVVENLPYERLMQNYDSADTVFFCDPPYVGPSTGAYDGWDQQQMIQFRSHLDRLKGRFLVTVNDSPANRQLFGDCKLTPVVTRNRRVNNRTDSSAVFGELIISKP